MCFGFTYDSAADYREQNPDYEYTEFVNGDGDGALLVFDKDEGEPFVAYNAILPDGDRFGWDSREACIEFLKDKGFTEKPAESTEEAGREAANA